MATKNKNLSSYKSLKISDASSMRIGIAVSEWNSEVTEALYLGAVKTLLNEGVKAKNIIRRDVPGSFELPLAALWLNKQSKVDAIICLGCVITGETKHDEYISHAVAQGIMNLSLQISKPVIFGVLTPKSMQQALDRSGGKHGNKGVEAAITALKMLNSKKPSKN